MKRITIVCLILILLSGCDSASSEIDKAQLMRQKLLDGKGCQFTATVTADYGEEIYTFEMSCIADQIGNMQFTVLAPDSIQGITGKIENEKGKLTFDDQILAFEILADGQITPVSAPWLLVKTMRGGYIRSCGVDGEYLRTTIFDSYEEDALQLDIWLTDELTPVQGEILFRGRRILTIHVINFSYL